MKDEQLVRFLFLVGVGQKRLDTHSLAVTGEGEGEADGGADGGAEREVWVEGWIYMYVACGGGSMRVRALVHTKWDWQTCCKVCACRREGHK